MLKMRWLVPGVAVLFAVALVGAAVAAQPQSRPSSRPSLPEAVSKAFKAEFPKGEILKADEEKEEGVTVYDIEFKDGGVSRETDIAADGTILTAAIVVDAKTVPEAAMKAIQTAAAGATVVQIEKIEVRCETKDGKIVKLDKPKTNFEAELKKGDQAGEVAVDAKGVVVEAVKWAPATKAETKPAK